MQLIKKRLESFEVKCKGSNIESMLKLHLQPQISKPIPEKGKCFGILPVAFFDTNRHLLYGILALSVDKYDQAWATLFTNEI